MSASWIILDPNSGLGVPIERFPFFIGGGISADLRLMEPGLPEVLAELQPSGSHLLIQPRGGELALADGTLTSGAMKLSPGSEHGLLLQGQPLLIFSTRDSSRAEACRPIRWTEAKEEAGPDSGPVHSTEELRRGFRQNQARRPNSLYRVVGSRPRFNLDNWAAKEAQAAVTAVTEPVESFTGIKGRCPQCWMTFRPGEVMAISCHEDLRGDPLWTGGDAAVSTKEL